MLDGWRQEISAMLAVNAVRRGGRWKVENIDALTV